MPAVSGTPTQISASVASLADLAGLPDDAFLDGELAFVQSSQTTYQLLRNASSGIASFSGNGHWVLYQVNTAFWATQASWYIDPTSGSDENDGSTSTTALKTWAEFQRRVPTVFIPTTVTFLGTTIEKLYGSFKSGSSTASLVIQGTPTVFASGTVTTFVDPVPATNTRGTITCTDLTRASDGAAINFDTCVGKMVMSPATSATSDFFIPVLASVAGVAQVGWWARTSLSNTKPANNAAIQVWDLPTCDLIVLSGDGLPIQVRYMKVGGAYPYISQIDTGNVITAIGSSSYLGKWVCCEFTYLMSCGDGSTGIVGCLWSAASSQIISSDVNASIYGGGSTSTTLTINAPGRAIFQGFLLQGGKLIVGGTSANAYSNGVSVECVSTSAPLGVYGSTSHGIEVQGGACFGANIMWGASNNGYGLVAKTGARCNITGTPTITGTSGDLNLSNPPGVAAGSVVPVTNGVPTGPAAACSTWATWAGATFNRYIVNQADGSRISGGA